MSNPLQTNPEDTTISSDLGLDLITKLKGLEGAISYDGDASCQVVFMLTNGKTLRFGVTDDDVGSGMLWVDQYEGLALKAPEGSNEMLSRYAAKLQSENVRLKDELARTVRPS